MEETEEEVDLRPRRPADDRRYDECGVNVPGLRLVRLARTLVTLPIEEAVSRRGRGGMAALVGTFGLSITAMRAGVGPDETRWWSEAGCCDDGPDLRSEDFVRVESCSWTLPFAYFARFALSRNKCLSHANCSFKGDG